MITHPRLGRCFLLLGFKHFEFRSQHAATSGARITKRGIRTNCKDRIPRAVFFVPESPMVWTTLFGDRVSSTVTDADRELSIYALRSCAAAWVRVEPESV